MTVDLSDGANCRLVERHVARAVSDAFILARTWLPGAPDRASGLPAAALATKMRVMPPAPAELPQRLAWYRLVLPLSTSRGPARFTHAGVARRSNHHGLNPRIGKEPGGNCQEIMKIGFVPRANLSHFLT